MSWCACLRLSAGSVATTTLPGRFARTQSGVMALGQLAARMSPGHSPPPSACAALSTASGALRKELHLKDTDQVLLLGRGDRDKERLSFGDLRARAAEAKADKGRELIRVIRSGGGKSNVSAAFSLMSPSELEVAVRMARQKKSRVIHERVNLDEGQDEAAFGGGSERIREKQLVISANLGEEHLQLTTRRVRKWLEKGRFQVRVTVSPSTRGHQGAEEVAQRLREGCADLLEGREEALNIKVKS